MENTLVLGPALVGGGARRRVVALMVAITLVLAMFVVVQNIDSSPAGASVTATASADSAQINFGQIVCAILIPIRNAFANTPFGGFVTPILNALLQAFGCAPS